MDRTCNNVIPFVSQSTKSDFTKNNINVLIETIIQLASTHILPPWIGRIHLNGPGK